MYIYIQTLITAITRRTAVRETGIPQHHARPIEAPLPPWKPLILRQYGHEGFKGSPSVSSHYAERYEPFLNIFFEIEKKNTKIFL